MIRRSGYFLCLLVLALAACSGTGKRGSATVAAFDFGEVEVAAEASRLPLPLGLEVKAPPWLDSGALHYRLRYADPGRLHEYAQARWVGPPSQLLQQALAQRYALDTGKGGAPCLLRVDIDEFAQVFTSAQASHGKLQVRLTLLDRRRWPLAETARGIVVPAPTPDAQGGRIALRTAVRQLGEQVETWLATVRDRSEAGVCGWRR